MQEADLLNEFEGEIRKQLKRQSAAHREHLADVLEAHTEKLSADHKIHLAHELNRQKLVHGNEMTKIVSRLYGVESLMDLVDGAERKNKKTRELWLSAQSLNCVLNKEFHGGKTKNLLPEIGSIAKISGKSALRAFLSFLDGVICVFFMAFPLQHFFLFSHGFLSAVCYLFL